MLTTNYIKHMTFNLTEHMKAGEFMNFCDYDSMEHYPSGSFTVRHKTVLTKKLKEVEKQILPEWLTLSFLKCEYRTCITLDDLVLYRIFGLYRMKDEDSNLKPPVGAKSLGCFASTEFAESLIDAKMRLALDPSWLNTKVYEEKILLPKGNIINVGIVAPVKLKTGVILPGGADQILLPQNWREEWVIGYRRVTSRQLMNPPSFTLKKSDLPEFDIKETLYKITACCCCGGSDVTKLDEADQVAVIGSKNNRYILKYHCNNPDCGFYW